MITGSCRSGRLAIALISAAMALAGCSDDEVVRSFHHHSPTLDPPHSTLGDGLPLPEGMWQVHTIPTDKLTTDRLDRFTTDEVCTGVPPTVPKAVGFAGAGEEAKAGCRWYRGRQLLIIGAPVPMTMAEQVAEHDAGNGYAHLAWLRGAGHYVIERILAEDESSACTHVVDVGASRAVHVVVMRAHPATGDPVPTPPRQGLKRYCPDVRAVTMALLEHVDTLAAEPAGSATFPTTTSATGPPLTTSRSPR